MKSTYVGTRSANVGDIRWLFALASDSTSKKHSYSTFETWESWYLLAVGGLFIVRNLDSLFGLFSSALRTTHHNIE